MFIINRRTLLTGGSLLAAGVEGWIEFSDGERNSINGVISVDEVVANLVAGTG
jgi:hypothetical protein